MKHNLDFHHVVSGKKVRIQAYMDGLLPAGNNGYRVAVWDAVAVDHQEPLARFTIDFNGRLFEWNDDLNPQFCEQNNLASEILKRGQEGSN